MSKEIELMPCPHCGGTNLQVDYNGVYERHFVRCYNHDCHTQGPEVYGRGKAVEAWNALPRALVWSSEPPSEPGFWWWELCGNRGVDLIQDPEMRVIRDYRAKWAGPIPEPKTILYPQLNEERRVITFSALKQDEKKDSL